jgi:hypothetical protein
MRVDRIGNRNVRVMNTRPVHQNRVYHRAKAGIANHQCLNLPISSSNFNEYIEIINLIENFRKYGSISRFSCHIWDSLIFRGVLREDKQPES